MPAERIHLGVAYYPEHWNEERWPEDIRLMREMGVSVVRMAEFAWSTLEPADGVFQFEWLDRVIALLAEAGISTILGTPTASPPAWLVSRYDEILAVDETDQRVQLGNRCHYCVNSDKFQQACRQLILAMAKQFGQNENIIGWQLDNEYSRVCYCDHCSTLFQLFLQERYGSLEELNRRWSTRYWSQTYSAWDQIPIPIGSHNPGLMLDFKRFVTASYLRFQQQQLDCLRPNLHKQAWVTHNFMGWYDGFDHYKMSADLDFASWDSYVGSGYHDCMRLGAMHDLVRGFKRHNFWVMETQPGSVNWSPVNNMLNKGEARVMAWQAIGHGADGILFWQWRSALGGQEQYHGTLVDQSGRPRPFYEEARQLGKDLAALGDLLENSRPVTNIALLYDYESRWSIQWQRHHTEFDYVAHFLHYYKQFAARNIPVDILSADIPLTGYRMVILPALHIMTPERAESIKQFVHKGGHLVISARCGMKDIDNALLPQRQPGPMEVFSGVEVEEYYALDQPIGITGNWFKGESRIWAERLNTRGDKTTAIIARYNASNGWLDNQVAITVKGYGSGLVYYVGAYLDDMAQEALFERFLRTAMIKPMMITPKGVEVCKRVNLNGEQFLIIINHNPIELKVPFPWAAYDRLTDQQVEGELTLAPYGVAVLVQAAQQELGENISNG